MPSNNNTDEREAPTDTKASEEATGMMIKKGIAIVEAVKEKNKRMTIVEAELMKDKIVVILRRFDWSLGFNIKGEIK
ncbi:12623_t:CDS:2 [Dentiscutata erythropus]|uniref:12623_t:CDS:1 n=1 Tax=Dentiscutata erythropus TaxID=1348616 RepID=A0A9N9I1C0_9GLOM|nr:12623_t:CDS:2 [Dentiscutata erythropus]